MDNQQLSLDYIKGFIIGLIEGEGTICLIKYSPTIQVGNTDKQIVDYYTFCLDSLKIPYKIYSRILKSGKIFTRVDITGFDRVGKLFKEIPASLFQGKRKQAEILLSYTETRKELAWVKGSLNLRPESSETNTPNTDFAKGYVVSMILGEGSFGIYWKPKGYFPTIIIASDFWGIIKFVKECYSVLHIPFYISGTKHLRIEVCGIKRLKYFFDKIDLNLFWARWEEAFLMKTFIEKRLSDSEFDENGIVDQLQSWNKRRNS